LIEVGVDATAEIVRDELVRPLVLAHDLRLPVEVLGHDVVLEIFPLQLVPGVEDAVAGRQVGPRIHKLAPIDETPDAIDRVGRLVFPLQALQKGSRSVRRHHAVRERLVIDLIADDGRVVLEVADDLANDAFRRAAEVRVQEIVILPGTVVAGLERRRIAGRVRIGQRRRGPVVGHGDLGVLLV
jgi:hypothetical protein